MVLQQLFISPISLITAGMSQLCHTVLSQGHSHNCCPECFLSFSLAHTCSMPGSALILFGCCFFTVCDCQNDTILTMFACCICTFCEDFFFFFLNLAILQNQCREICLCLSWIETLQWHNYFLTVPLWKSFLTVPLWNSDMSLLRGGKRKLPICFSCIFHPCKNVPKSSNFLRFLKCLVEKSQQRYDKLHQLKIF